MLLHLGKKKLEFKPGMFATIVTALAIMLFCSLGFWQLERSEMKRQLAEEITMRMQQPVLSINRETADRLNGLDMEYRHIETRGDFESEYQFFVDNKKYHGKAGYHVVTPFKIEETGQVILVNRGWVDAGNDRNVLPDISTPEGIVNLSGQLQKPAKAIFRPGISKPAEKMGGIWLYMDTAYFSSLSGLTVMPYILLLDEQNSFGYVREWPAFEANTEMHVGYAIQWFAFAIFALLAYVSLGIKKHA